MTTLSIVKFFRGAKLHYKDQDYLLVNNSLFQPVKLWSQRSLQRHKNKRSKWHNMTVGTEDSGVTCSFEEKVEPKISYLVYSSRINHYFWNRKIYENLKLIFLKISFFKVWNQFYSRLTASRVLVLLVSLLHLLVIHKFKWAKKAKKCDNRVQVQSPSSHGKGGIVRKFAIKVRFRSSKIKFDQSKFYKEMW